jgi:DNA-binding response OmpR family regulator
MDTMKIFIIDSSKEDAESLSALLKEEGYNAYHASTVYEAIKKLKSDIPDLIITDIKFPNIKGLDFVSQIKKTAPKTPTIVLSAQDDIEDIEEFFAQGIDDYIVKPPRISYLLKRIEHLITGADQARLT